MIKSEIMYEKIQETKKFIHKTAGYAPEIGIVLGTGLGNFTNQIEILKTIPYAEIPNFPVSTVQFGKVKDKIIVALKGRFHYYEGYSMQQVTFPIRVMKSLGINHLFLSNASGGTNSGFEVGDMMIIEDHINLTGQNPLIGKNDDRLGPRFPDMSEVYDRKLIELAMQVASEQKIKYVKGVYAAVTGPNYETPAEYRYIQKIGADAVGMSTVPEAIAAKHLGMKIIGISYIANMAAGSLNRTGHGIISHEDVIKTVSNVKNKFSIFIERIIENLN